MQHKSKKLFALPLFYTTFAEIKTFILKYLITYGMLLLSLLFMEGFYITGNAQTYPVRQWDYQDGLSNNYVHSLTHDKRGYLWIATEEGLSRFDGIFFKNYFKHDPQTLSLTGNELNCVLDDPSDPLLWIGTQRFGLNCYNYAQNTFRVFRSTGHPDSLVTNDVTSLCPDIKGNLWIGTYWQGVDYYDKAANKFIHYNQSTVKGFPSNHIQALYDDGKGNLYIGHYKGGFTVLNLRSHTFRNYSVDKSNPASLPDNSVHRIFKDSAGHLWVGSEKGLCLFLPATGRFIRVNNLVHGVYDLLEPRKGELWVAMEQGGVAILHTSSLPAVPQASTLHLPETRPYSDMGYAEESVRCLQADDYGNIWTGVWGEGIKMFSHTPPLFSFIRYSPVPSVQSLNVPIVLSVCEDRKGRL